MEFGGAFSNGLPLRSIEQVFLPAASVTIVQFPAFDKFAAPAVRRVKFLYLAFR
ncbi:MAG: Uncharacterised protein [Methanobacteriota archaeon]|nr:MAG: Uncharacterised protein [Euryarchaeota archaeon]